MKTEFQLEDLFGCDGQDCCDYASGAYCGEGATESEMLELLAQLCNDTTWDRESEMEIELGLRVRNALAHPYRRSEMEDAMEEAYSHCPACHQKPQDCLTFGCAHDIFRGFCQVCNPWD